jgi:hypothetical protein
LVDEQSYGSAYRTLMPLANDPHNRGENNPATALLAEIKEKWDAAINEEKVKSAANPAPVATK